MEEKNKNNRLTILFCMIIILLMILCGFLGVKAFNQKECNIKCENKDNNLNDNINNNDSQNNQQDVGFVKPEEHVEIEENIKTKLIEVFKSVYNYREGAYYGNYCYGDYDSNDKIEPLKSFYKEEYSYYYKGNFASNEYSSFKEMVNHLKKYMTEEVIFGIYDMSSDIYVEKNGKLYCPLFSTGKGNVYEFEHAKIKYSKPGDNSDYYVTIETTLVSYDDNHNEIFDVIFEKQNDNWIISSYKQVQY